MSEIKNGRLGLYGAEHLKCNHIITLGFKGLNALLQGSTRMHNMTIDKEVKSSLAITNVTLWINSICCEEVDQLSTCLRPSLYKP